MNPNKVALNLSPLAYAQIHTDQPKVQAQATMGVKIVDGDEQFKNAMGGKAKVTLYLKSEKAKQSVKVVYQHGFIRGKTALTPYFGAGVTGRMFEVTGYEVETTL